MDRDPTVGRRSGIFDRWGNGARAAAFFVVAVAVAGIGWQLGAAEDEPAAVQRNSPAVTTIATPASDCSSTAPGPMPGNASDVTTATVDFDGDGTSDVLRVYQSSGSWHVRASIAGVDVDDEVIAGSGPQMSAVGGATVDGDALEEAWVKTGSGSATDIVGLYVYRSCELLRVNHDEDGQPVEFPIGASVTRADGLRCLPANAGFEVFESTSTDGITYTGSSQVYELVPNLNGPGFVIVPGASNTLSEANPPGGAAFQTLTKFECDSLTTIP